VPLVDKQRRAKYSKEYREKNLDKVNAKNKKWKQENKRLVQEHNKRWLLNYPEYNKRRSQIRIKKLYGLTVEDFEKLLARQGQRCAICGFGFTGRKKVVDHDHAGGQVRGILHFECNVLLGLAQERTETLYGAIRYLKDWEYDNA
jgi:hypothetical protein